MIVQEPIIEVAHTLEGRKIYLNQHVQGPHSHFPSRQRFDLTALIEEIVAQAVKRAMEDGAPRGGR